MNTDSVSLRFRRRQRALAAVLMLGMAGSAAEAGDVSFSRGYTFDQRDGESLYQNICQGCHMPDAAGASGAGQYPALARNPRLAAKLNPALLVVNGQGAMPPFGHGLDDEQVAAVVNYLRTHFGNAYTDTLTAAEVKPLRK